LSNYKPWSVPTKKTKSTIEKREREEEGENKYFQKFNLSLATQQKKKHSNVLRRIRGI